VLVHDDVGDAAADVDDGLGGGAGVGIGQLGEVAPVQRPHQRERDEVDAHRLQAGDLQRGEQRPEHVAVGGDDEHAQALLDEAVVGRDRHRLDHLVIDDRLGDRDRDQLLDLERQARPELVVVQHGELGRPGHDPLAGDAGDHLPALEAGVTPQPLDGGPHGGGVDDLAAHDRTGVEGDLAEADQGRLAAREADLGCPHGGGADVEADQGPRHCVLSARRGVG
jgi:hypothetical protein